MGQKNFAGNQSMRAWLIAGIVLVALFCLPGFQPASKLVAAADHAKAGHSEEKKGEAATDETNPFKGALDLSIYTILVFVILYSLLRAYAWKPIAEGLDRREQSIAQAKLDAENARKEAAELRQSLEAKLAKANEEIRQMLDKARQDAQQTAAEELARGKAELQAERQRLQRELEMSRDAALREVWNQGADLATLISSKVIRKNLTVDDHRVLLEEALAEFRAAAQNRRTDIESATA